MGFFWHNKEKAISGDQGGADQHVRSEEEIVALVLKKRWEEMEKLNTEKSLLEAIRTEGLDAAVDFKLNTDSAPMYSVRLNRQKDGSYLLFTVGERGIDWQKTFQDPNEAYYNALLTVRQMKAEVERMGWTR